MTYFEKEMKYDKIFGSLGLGAPTVQNAKQWLERIENDLSPENLSCDGELRGRALQTKRASLEAAKRHCNELLYGYDKVAAGAQYMLSRILSRDLLPRMNQRARYRNLFAPVRAKRTADRMKKLDEAVQNGFVPGVRILISNGTTGTIIKVNRTRVTVKGDDGRMWSVPPRCMTLVKGR